MHEPFGLLPCQPVLRRQPLPLARHRNASDDLCFAPQPDAHTVEVSSAGTCLCGGEPWCESFFGPNDQPIDLIGVGKRKKKRGLILLVSLNRSERLSKLRRNAAPSSSGSKGLR